MSITLGLHFNFKTSLAYLRIMYSHIEPGLSKFGYNRYCRTTARIGCVFLIAEAKDRYLCFLRGRCLRLSLNCELSWDYDICESCLLLQIHCEYIWPESSLIMHIVRVKYVDKALEVFFEARSTKARRTLQILAPNTRITLKNRLNISNITSWILLAKNRHRIDCTDPLR